MHERKERRNGAGSLYVAVIAALMLIAALIGISVFFRVSDISVVGNSVYDGDELVKAAGIKLDDNILFISDSQAAARIRNAYPYVDSVRILKKLPGTVVIEITENLPIAFIPTEDADFILDHTGKILERRDKGHTGGLIEIRGAQPIMPAAGQRLSFGEEQTLRLEAMKSVLDAVRRAGMGERIQWLDVTALSSIRFMYENRFTVDMGRGDDAEQKLYILSRIAKDHPTERANVDLSDSEAAHYIPN